MNELNLDIAVAPAINLEQVRSTAAPNFRRPLELALDNFYYMLPPPRRTAGIKVLGRIAAARYNRPCSTEVTLPKSACALCEFSSDVRTCSIMSYMLNGGDLLNDSRPPTV